MGYHQEVNLNFQPKRPTRDRAQWPQSFENWPLRPKFQSCSNQLKLNIQSLLTLLITKMPEMSILSQNCGILWSSRASILYHGNIEARLLNKLPQFWLKIDILSTFVIRKVRRLWIFNFNWFDQLCNFEFIKRIAKFSFASWGLNFDVIKKLIS